MEERKTETALKTLRNGKNTCPCRHVEVIVPRTYYFLQWSKTGEQGVVVGPGRFLVYLTIIPRARMGSELIAREAEGRKGY